MQTNIIIQGDCIQRIKELPENSIDAIVTDPPYGLEFMGKDWDKLWDKRNKDDNHSQNKWSKKLGDKSGHKGFAGMLNNPVYKAGKEAQDFHFLWAIECLRVLKPGGYLLSFGGSRTYHRMACAIEDAGFEIRDQIMWLYGSGFPKALDIGRNIDREVCNKEGKHFFTEPNEIQKKKYPIWHICDYSNEGDNWREYKTSLKPAHEPIVVARKPLSEKNVASNVLKHGTGGINIDGCRIETNPEVDDMLRKVDRKQRQSETWEKGSGFKNEKNSLTGVRPEGRFPANVILDEEAGQMLDAQSGESKSSTGKCEAIITENNRWKNRKGIATVGHKVIWEGKGDKGGASRFFYCAKASKSERNLGLGKLRSDDDTTTDDGREVVSDRPHQRGATQRKNNHPTVKPIALMRYLVRLVTPKGGVVLDPFIGSGTTAIACLKENFKFIGIEKEEDYVKIAQARIKPFLEQRRL